MDLSNIDWATLLTGGAIPTALLVLKKLIVSSASVQRLKLNAEQSDKEKLWEQVQKLTDRIGHLEGRIESLEAERIQLHKRLAEEMAKNERLTALLAEREEYITQLEIDHAKQAERIEQLTR